MKITFSNTSVTQILKEMWKFYSHANFKAMSRDYLEGWLKLCPPNYSVFLQGKACKGENALESIMQCITEK